MQKLFSRAAMFLAALSLVACGGAQSTQTTTSEQESHVAPATFADQVALGAQVYTQNCAGCHGASGEGSDRGPRVVGIADGALPLAPREGSSRTTQFTTVADVASFAVATMPPQAPGSLTAEQYWAVLAFDLHANGIDLDQPLTPELATTLTIPR